MRKIVLIFVFLLFIPAYFYLIKYSEGWTNRSIAGSIADGQPHQELVTQFYTVERVIDGDTLKLTNGKVVHLIGIKAPPIDIEEAKKEVMATGQDLDTINKMGQEATEALKNLLTLGMGQRVMEVEEDIESKVRLEFDVQRKDKYGRLLAYVYVWVCSDCEPGLPDWAKRIYNENDFYLFLNPMIVYSGYASPMTIPPNVKYAELFKELYEEAREQGRGLWKNEEVVKREGLYKEYYKSGELKGEGNWKGGIPYGEFKIYYKNGDVLKIMNYKEGKLDGISKSFYPEGVLMREERYQEGTRISDKSFFDGKLRLIREYTNNKLIREVEYDKEGKLISEEGEGE